MLEINDCGAGYPGKNVLHSITLSVETGRTACIIGPSGCGKTTLLMVAAGLKKPDAGKVRLDGAEVAAGDLRVGLILQQYGLFPWFTAGQNVALGLRIRGIDARRRQGIVRRELERVGLGECSDSYPCALSGGQQQRVAIARSLALAPKLLLMDEPFSALDAMTRESLQEVLLALLRETGLTVLLVTHSIEEAVYLGSTIWLMAGYPGRLVACFDNPGQSAPGYREDPAFFRLCTEIRRSMEPFRVP